MKNKQKLLIVISALLLMLINVTFLCNTRNISGIISTLNGNTNNFKIDEMPAKAHGTNDIKTVNTAALGQYKLNKSSSPNGGYLCLEQQNLVDIANAIINNDGKILIIGDSTSLNAEINIACLQFIAGDDYDNVKNYYLKSFNDESKDNALKYFNQQLSEILNVNINDVPYINCNKFVKNYLRDKGLNDQGILCLQAKLKENCN